MIPPSMVYNQYHRMSPQEQDEGFFNLLDYFTDDEFTRMRSVVARAEAVRRSRTETFDLKVKLTP